MVDNYTGFEDEYRAWQEKSRSNVWEWPPRGEGWQPMENVPKEHGRTFEAWWMSNDGKEKISTVSYKGIDDVALPVLIDVATKYIVRATAWRFSKQEKP